MSIRDIIEAATPGPWEASDPNRLTGECSIAKRSAQGLLLGISNVSIDPHNARFIATFDPDHVALMEAVCKAVGRCGSGLVMDAPHEWRTVTEAYDALQTYRKERGL